MNVCLIRSDDQMFSRNMVQIINQTKYKNGDEKFHKNVKQFKTQTLRLSKQHCTEYLHVCYNTNAK